jgi:phosphate/sulfate permease
LGDKEDTSGHGQNNKIASDPLQKKEQKCILGHYRNMMLAAAMLVCLGHGSNDVANGIAPLLVVMEREDMNETGAYLLGSAGIALGLLLLGSRVMETVGKKVIKLDFAKGFSA